MGCGETILRCLGGIYIFYFWIVGIGLVVYGSFSAYLILITNPPTILRDYGTVIPSILTIIFGILLVVFVFLGCCGICRESKCCLESYSAFLILLGLAHLAVGGYCIIMYTNNIQYGVSMRLQMTLDMTRYVDNYRHNPKPMDDIQDWMSCCGVENPIDEYNFGYGQLPHNNELPSSCCDNGDVCNKNSNDRYTDGCAQAVTSFTVGTNLYLGYVSVAVGAAEIVAALLALCLSCCIWRRSRTIYR